MRTFASTSTLERGTSSKAAGVALILLLSLESLLGAESLPIPQALDGEVVLHASNAVVHGTMLRYEPQTNKNCLGFWTKAEDWADWSFEVRQPTTFEVEVWQGCGKGQAGSDVAVEVGDKRFDFVVEETGHFQIFLPRKLGRVELTAGRHTLSVKPQRKKAGAVMDIRQVRLLRATGLPPASAAARELSAGCLLYTSPSPRDS